MKRGLSGVGAWLLCMLLLAGAAAPPETPGAAEPVPVSVLEAATGDRITGQ